MPTFVRGCNASCRSRVTNARVIVGGRVVGQIGLACLFCLDLKLVTHLRTLIDCRKDRAPTNFEDDAGLMNLSAGQVGGAICVVSQFTLYGDARKEIGLLL